ncbi:hypothetical protein GUITHDRAFT_135841 [Guillardia theta CCMP2712]|uniref:U-box domain-containing protein n=1 Tax=Guillardia theta (strain CCMP2712) TaxID=905079 RepID=L1JMI5_GUITC|nr:hypothetical protein GUITHDRAFT_135841 [Guillardia theta CCMP2712]EKX49667.1 hypothetical protein GUITHDRAFT_135841 [Guillardia theta CCMP2712]|eukprot:XP_005836647.1 hypothetical protein GUITHDRAFT_135841 [Guillardia theta CCMP2712]
MLRMEGLLEMQEEEIPDDDQIQMPKGMFGRFFGKKDPPKSRDEKWIKRRFVLTDDTFRYFRPSENSERERRDRALAAMNSRTAPRIEFGSDKIYTRDFEEILVNLGNFVICSEVRQLNAAKIAATQKEAKRNQVMAYLRCNDTHLKARDWQDLAYPGFAIREIAPRSIAAESRLQVGDVIEKVNNCSVKGKEKEVLSIIRNGLQTNESIDLQILRPAQEVVTGDIIAVQGADGKDSVRSVSAMLHKERPSAPMAERTSLSRKEAQDLEDRMLELAIKLSLDEQNSVPSQPEQPRKRLSAPAQMEDSDDDDVILDPRRGRRVVSHPVGQSVKLPLKSNSNDSSHIPDEFLCPITLEPMSNPVLAADGFSYEKEAMEEWLALGHRSSPKTGAPLSHLSLTQNHALRNLIREYVWAPQDAPR